MTTTKLKWQIAVVEDDKTLREYFVSSLQACGKFDVVFQSASLAKAIEWFTCNSVSALLVDLGLPDGNGIELIRFCRQRHPKCEILVISIFEDQHNVLAAIEAGASGYLLKSEPSHMVGDAVENVLKGGSPISPKIARMILNKIEQPAEDQNLLPNLTQREKQVLKCLMSGLSYQEAADHLSLKLDTIRTYIKSIYRKLEVNTKGQAVYLANKLGFANQTSNRR